MIEPKIFQDADMGPDVVLEEAARSVMAAPVLAKIFVTWLGSIPLVIVLDFLPEFFLALSCLKRFLILNLHEQISIFRHGGIFLFLLSSS